MDYYPGALVPRHEAGGENLSGKQRQSRASSSPESAGGILDPPAGNRKTRFSQKNDQSFHSVPLSNIREAWNIARV
jgi:hypothetical protein